MIDLGGKVGIVCNNASISGDLLLTASRAPATPQRVIGITLAGVFCNAQVGGNASSEPRVEMRTSEHG